MPYWPSPKLNLKSIILLFAFFSVAATVLNDLLVTYRIQKQTLIQNALESNSAYAAKIAISINESLISDLDKLKYSAEMIGASPSAEIMSAEADRLVRQDGSFNTVIVTNEAGVIIATQPDNLKIIGQKLLSLEPIEQRREMVSRAYWSLKGNLIIFVSYPIWGDGGKYLGLIGGTIYLGVQNSLNTIINHHFYRDNSYVYLVDDKRRILSHPQAERIGEIANNSPVVEALLKNDSGSVQATNSQGREMLAGYARVTISGWGVVSQQPLEEVENSVNELIYKQMITIIPTSLLGLFFIWWVATKISLPLQQLSESASNLSGVNHILKIRAWYQEAWKIRIALLAGVESMQQQIGTLDHQAKSDSLTQLANRRAFEDILEIWQATGAPFSAISLDIDHFKRVNDTFGHDVGDSALQQVAAILKNTCRAKDLPCRVGGEEFFILLPDTPLTAAADAAERIRSTIATSYIDPVGYITVSLGVTCSMLNASTPLTLKKADELLYHAKQTGRNRVVVDLQYAGESIEVCPSVAE